MFFLSDLLNKKLTLPKPGQALAGRTTSIHTAASHHVSGRPLKGPFRKGGDRAVRHGLLLGRRAAVLAAADGVWVTAVGYAGGDDAQPDLSGDLHRPDRPCRGRCWWSSTRRSSPMPSCSSCSGRTTTRRKACARATTSAPPTARRSTLSSEAQLGRRSPRATPMRPRCGTPGAARSPPRSRRRRAFYFAEEDHQQYLAKNPYGYCGLTGTGVACAMPDARRRLNRRFCRSGGSSRPVGLSKRPKFQVNFALRRARVAARAGGQTLLPRLPCRPDSDGSRVTNGKTTDRVWIT